MKEAMVSQEVSKFKVTDAADSRPTLAAGPKLAALSETATHHLGRGFRHPLAIYNVSIARITARGQRFADLLYQYFTTVYSLRDGQKIIRTSIDEHLELLVYALDAHVDDCELILKLCFPSDNDYARSKITKAFKEHIRSIRRPVSVLCNALKHNHQRVRFFESEFFTVRGKLMLLGFFLERAVGGEIHPDTNFLGTNKRVISCVGFVWSSLIAIMQISSALASAVSKIDCDNTALPGAYAWNEIDFKKLVLSTALLPLYTFDDDSPFATTSLTVSHDLAGLSQPLIGSFLDPIRSRAELGGIGSWQFNYVGDGVTKKFKIAVPSRASFHSVAQEQE